MGSKRETVGSRLRGARTLLCVAALVALTGALWGCADEPHIAQPPPRMPAPPDLGAIIDRIGRNASRWRTMDAKCRVTVSSAYLRGQGGQITRRGGRLRLQKPGKIMLRVPERGEVAFELVGDGERYEINMPVFGESYSARYGSPLPEGQLRIMFMPDDLVDALDYTNLIRGWGKDKAPVVRQLGRLCVVDSLVWVREPEPAIYVGSSLTIEPRSNNVMLYRKYRPDGSLRTEIRYPRWDLFEAAEGEGDRQTAARLPVSVWLAYPAGQTLIAVTLQDVTLNESLDPAQFQVGR